MYFAFAFWLDDTIGGWAWALAWSAGGSHVLQTNHAETQRRLYQWRAYGMPWLRHAPRTAATPSFRRESWFTRWFGFWAVGYVWLSKRMSAERQPDRRGARRCRARRRAERIRAIVRRHARALAPPRKGAGRQSQDLHHRRQRRARRARSLFHDDAACR